MEFKKVLTYSELKKWFGENSLPVTLQGEDMYYSDVSKSVEMWLSTIENEFELNGKENIKSSIKAKRAKRRLLTLFIDLKRKENWNAKMMTVEQYLENQNSNIQ